jgi:regulator of cell morphogenesis and NO signaling
MAIDVNQTVGDLVRGNPSTVGIFESIGIDYCCGGGKSLSAACAAAGLSLDQVVGHLEEALNVPPIAEDCHWLTCPLKDLIDHITEKHHAYSWRQMPVLLALAAKVNMRHGTNRPELAKLHELADALARELTTHMLKEENVLFPAFRRMQEAADTGHGLNANVADALLRPVRHMTEDHDDAGELLRAMRAVTNGFELPAGACTSFQALYGGLKEHEADLHRHIHLENNILFPRALEMARSSSSIVA